MTEYQELFNKITKEIGNKRKELPILKQKVEEAEERYNKLFEDISNLKEILEEKREELEELIHKNDNKIFIKIVALVAFLIATVGGLLTILSINLLSYFQILNTFTNIIIGTLLGIIVIILPAFTSINIIKKLFKKSTTKSHDKIMDSSEYKNLVKEIEKLENDLSVKKSLQRTEEKYLDEVKTEYNVTITEINMKETLLEYLKNNKKTSPNNMNYEHEIKEIEDIKIPKKVRKKD